MEKMSLTSRIYVAGHQGLVGSSIVRNLEKRGYSNLITKTRWELDLLDQNAVHRFFEENGIEFAFIAAAKVGGILYNRNFAADFLYENVVIAANIIHAAAKYDVKKLLYLGSSCIYPKLAHQPITEDQLLTGPLESTNEGYALSKIVGLKLCEKFQVQYGKRFISAMPTNLFGPRDNFHPEHSHVIPGLLRRFHEAKINRSPQVMLWGTGTPKREFLYVDDLADALHLIMQEYEGPETINCGTGQDCTILELAHMVKDTVGYQGQLTFDPSKPDGTPRKVLDVSKISKLGWAPRYTLTQGLQLAYQWALENGAFNARAADSRQPLTV